ncbi:hypothetical protein [Maricaulis salignorans]|uniref:Uncharacterized protein n=1 Tax=Maricaulis salignorans TaxID=144026 RepID=A0A1G9QQ76_9PROT|nr:hypothetical protein [Maricaulis salignorans]SDM13020.1 hypothetical protein SAMN04488568_105115 [Maricaulis salignorans]
MSMESNNLGCPEAVAYALMLHMAAIEGVSLAGGENSASKKWIMNTYAKCLQLVKQQKSD